MLIINTEQKSIYHFEPHGSSYRGRGGTKSIKMLNKLRLLKEKINKEKDKNVRNKLKKEWNELNDKYNDVNKKLLETIYGQLKNLFEVKLKKILPKYKYYPPSQICPRIKGIQTVENKIKTLNIEGAGYCNMWSLLFLEMVLLNPDKTINEIVDLLTKIAEDDPEYIMDVIRGYVWTAKETLELFGKEKLGVDDFTYITDSKQRRKFLKKNKNKYEAWINETLNNLKNSEIIDDLEGGSKLSKGFAKFSEKINPMSYALKNKKTRNLMTSSGDVTHDYIMPAVVEAGKPIAEASAMAASTALTGNPILGKVVFDSLWRNMVEKKGYSPIENQKSKTLGKVAKATGAVGEAYVGKNLG